MVRNTSKCDLGAMQLSGMTHSASTLNFLQDALDDEVSEKFLNRVPSWKDLQRHASEEKHNNDHAHPTMAAADSPGKSLPHVELGGQQMLLSMGSSE